MIGLGSESAKICVYIENIPPLTYYQNLSTLVAIQPDEIQLIVEQTGNHWRKIFNVYAKLYFELSPGSFSSWQNFRDNKLLQAHSNQCLLFSPPQLKNKHDEVVHIIMGRTYANKVRLAQRCDWLSQDFAINKRERFIICPYFDYRQLSNVKISQLVSLIKSFDKNMR